MSKIIELRMRNFIEEFKNQILDLKERTKIKDAAFNKIMNYVCCMPEEKEIKLDNTDLWCILEYATYRYNIQRKLPLNEKLPISALIEEAYCDFENAGKENKRVR